MYLFEFQLILIPLFICKLNNLKGILNSALNGMHFGIFLVIKKITHKNIICCTLYKHIDYFLLTRANAVQMC